MQNFFKKKNNQKGYAILFTVVLVSAISVITAGLTNSTYKQLILSSLARDSQTAFYQSDTATDCALYADRVSASKDSTFTTTTHSWPCGGKSMTVSQVGTGYQIYPTVPDDKSIDPCFRIDVTKAPGTNSEGKDTIDTTIKAKGYNICNMDNSRTVEREIEIKYKEDVIL